ncbi:4521_t:CDS:1, partial [Scutellospora calospora]
IITSGQVTLQLEIEKEIVVKREIKKSRIKGEILFKSIELEKNS